jgi:hypothetical protein
LAIDCNAHAYLFSDCENNCGLEIDGLIGEYGLEVYNRGITPTFTGAGQNRTVNYSVVDITLSLNMQKDHKIEKWKVSSIPSGSDHRNVTFGYRAGGLASKETKMGRNYHRADWVQFRTLVNTNKMQKIAKRETWTKLLIKEMTKQWYESVDKAVNKVCPLKKIRVKEEVDWSDKDCEVAQQRYRSKYKSAHQRGRPSPADLKELNIHNRDLKNCMKHAKKARFREYVREVDALPAIAKLPNILRAKPSSKLGLVKKPDGSLYTSPEESLATMVREHFPGSVVTDSHVYSPPRSTEIKVEPIPWITPDRIWAAINSFGPHQTCGPDKLKRVVLQHLRREAVEALSSIFTAVIELGYEPT